MSVFKRNITISIYILQSVCVIQITCNQL